MDPIVYSERTYKSPFNQATSELQDKTEFNNIDFRQLGMFQSQQKNFQTFGFDTIALYCLRKALIYRYKLCEPHAEKVLLGL